MTTVNITTSKNTVTIDESNSSVISVATQGPQGPSFAASGVTLLDASKVDKSKFELRFNVNTINIVNSITSINGDGLLLGLIENNNYYIINRYIINI